MPKISIIIPMYNSVYTIDDTINSILKQKFEDYEVIVIDDGSSDDVFNHMKKYKDNVNIKIFYQDNNGVSSARNKGIMEASGEYIYFMDSDDILLDGALDCFVDEISDCDVCAFGYEEFNSKKSTIISSLDKVTDNLSEYVNILNESKLLNPIWNKIYKKEIIQNHNVNFRKDISIAEDLLFNINYFEHAKKYKVSNKIVYKYRISENGLGLKFRIESGQIRIDLDKKIKKIICNKGQDISFLYKIIIKDYFSFYSKIVDKRYKIKFIDKIKYIKNFHNDNFDMVKDIDSHKLSFKYKMLFYILKVNNVFIIYFFSFIANKIDLIQKRRRIGN